MVLGIGEGSIEILTESSTYKQGDTLKGKITMNLKQPKKARAIFVQLRATQEQPHQVSYRDSRGVMRRRTEKRKVTLFSRELRLDGEKSYAAGQSEYPFEFQLPVIAQPQAPNFGDNVVGSILGMVTNQLMPSPPVWEIHSWLDVPMSLDIQKAVAINVV